MRCTKQIVCMCSIHIYKQLCTLQIENRAHIIQYIYIQRKDLCVEARALKLIDQAHTETMTYLTKRFVWNITSTDTFFFSIQCVCVYFLLCSLRSTETMHTNPFHIRTQYNQSSMCSIARDTLFPFMRKDTQKRTSVHKESCVRYASQPSTIYIHTYMI